MNKLILALLLAQGGMYAQTISEKKAASLQKSEGGEIGKVNRELVDLRKELDLCYSEASSLHQKGAPEEAFGELLSRVKEIKGQIVKVEESWRESAVAEAKTEEEGYALWDQEETTLAQLVMEYGAMDYLFIVPTEMGNLKLNLHSGIPIPRESWGEVLEIVLAHNGIGVKKINAYTRQLFILKQDPSAIQAIASHQQDLVLIPDKTRLFYVLSPPLEQVKSIFQFFERFSDAKQTFVYQVGTKIAIVSSKEEIVKLLALYTAVWENTQGKVSRVVSVSKMGVKEMEKILQNFFGDAVEKGRPPFGKIEQDGLSIFSLGQTSALVLIGQQESVDRAEQIIHDTEDQLQDPSEMTVYLYNCRHSDPTDLAKVLEQVYYSLLMSATEGQKENTEVNFSAQGPGGRPPDGYQPTPPLIVTPPPLKPGVRTQMEVEKGPADTHFIPDPKTGNLLMVVRRDALPRIKELLRKLDVPKKMVEIEVLLFEKQLNTQNSFGMNLLKLGGRSNVTFTGADAPTGLGVLQFILSGSKSKHFPAYDLAYSFLMSQEDIQLNAAPSVITVNQTPATISIVDEISINNGAAPIDSNKGVVFEQSYSRAQYGITIVLTPTVHMPDDDREGDKGFVTLQTNITFDTPRPSTDNRPLVNRRHIENEVRVVDGQTVILGGLRKKTSQDSEDRVPFLGEIPGIGKLFGSTNLVDQNTEMFFFITPTIILDPQEQLDCFRCEELMKRPGDIPEFLEDLVEARRCEECRFFKNSIRMFFGDKCR